VATDGSTPPPERLQFNQVYEQWRDVVGELAALDLQYQTTRSRQRDALKARCDALVSQGNAMQEELFRAAMTAYARAPRENPDIAELLLGSVILLVSQEEYEEGLRVAQLLLDNGVGFTNLSVLAGTAAFATGEFEVAEKHWRRAKQVRELLGAEKQHLADIDYYQAGWTREQKLRAAEASADDLPRVLLQTTQGDIELELFENEAPLAVSNFIVLVESRFYDGLPFYRVISQTLAEAGCPNGDGSGGPGYALRGENDSPHARQHFRGTLGMVHSESNRIGSRFYITFVPARHLDGNHTVFGRVIRGMEVLAKLRRRTPPDSFTLKVNPHSNVADVPADRILAARVLRKRNHVYGQQAAQSTEPVALPRSSRPAGG
jgi:cyclophilin family peptidyl-prolyl cis-trans isomerase